MQHANQTTKGLSAKHAAHQKMLAEHSEAKEARKNRASTHNPRWHKLNGEICSDKSINWVSSFDSRFNATKNNKY